MQVSRLPNREELKLILSSISFLLEILYLKFHCTDILTCNYLLNFRKKKVNSYKVIYGIIILCKMEMKAVKGY